MHRSSSGSGAVGGPLAGGRWMAIAALVAVVGMVGCTADGGAGGEAPATALGGSTATEEPTAEAAGVRMGTAVEVATAEPVCAVRREVAGLPPSEVPLAALGDPAPAPPPGAVAVLGAGVSLHDDGWASSYGEVGGVAVRLVPGSAGPVDGVVVGDGCRLLDVVTAGDAVAVLTAVGQRAGGQGGGAGEVHVLGGATPWAVGLEQRCEEVLGVDEDQASVRCATVDAGMATVRPSGAERRQVIRPCPRGETPYVGWSGPDLRWTACSGEAPAVAVVGADGESHPVAGVVLGPVVDGALTWVVADDGLERIGEDGVVTSVPLADDVVAVSGASRLWAGGGHVVLDQPLEDDRRQLVVLDDVGTELTRLDYQSYRVSREPSPRIARLAVTDAGAWFSFAERLWWLPLP